jgi:hypothetical protein
MLHANITNEDAIVFDNGDYGTPFIGSWVNDENNKVLNSKSWLPRPLSMLDSLSDKRKKIYFARFLSRFKNGGWLIQLKRDEENVNVLNHFIFEHYIPSIKYENEQWIIIKFSPKIL